METPPSGGKRIVLRDVTVRPVSGIAERRHWDELVARHHYLGSPGLFGKALRHVAEVDGEWVALVGWQAGAFKVGVRDRWIGWSWEQQFRRLHLVANNARFTILERGRVANMASRVLGLSLRRLADDMRAVHGYPVVLAETFVDPSKFRGTCYRAANWQSLGLTQGYSREPGGSARWRVNGQPKEVFVFALEPDAAAVLRQSEARVDWQMAEKAAPMGAAQLRSLHDFLDTIPDFRRPRGKRYSLACFVTLMLAARLAGYRGASAFAEFAARLDQEQLEAVGAFWSPSRQRYTTPPESTFRYILGQLPPEALEEAFRGWTHQHSDPTTPVAVDGKDIRGASKQTDGGRRIMVAAVEHHSGLVLGQTQVDDKTNEMPAVRELSRDLELAGRTVTLDAMHAQHETARCLLNECGADYLVTAIKGNQQTMLDDLRAIDAKEWGEGRSWAQDWSKAHGRIEQRRCTAIDLTAKRWDGYCHLYGRRQAVRIERQRIVVKSGQKSHEIVYGLTSLGPEQAGPEELLALVRNHWTIENRLHYVRDVTYDEDRCQVRVGNRPRNLACLSNAAISIVRTCGRFRYLPQAHRHYASRSQDALDAVLKPLPANSPR